MQLQNFRVDLEKFEIFLKKKMKEYSISDLTFDKKASLCLTSSLRSLAYSSLDFVFLF